MAKNEVKAKQHPIANLIFFSLTLSSKNKNGYSKKCAESKYVCLNPVNHWQWQWGWKWKIDHIGLK